MVFPFDRAQALEQRDRDRSIAAQLAKSRTTGPSLSECQDCGGDIPKARQAFGGIVRCIGCQTIFEKRTTR
ncbi:TraR/DksA family transcriptional regulator [Pseudomonas helleri]|uniref:TraR/DksA family transcriptional regulator n=1 Tax=Pseudomonas helleri TaxID=1608996 RepID=UPI003FD22170